MKYIITFLITVSFATMAQEPELEGYTSCLLYTSPSPRDSDSSRMPSSA